jgi:transposase
LQELRYGGQFRTTATLVRFRPMPHPAVQAALYMATISAMRFNPVIQPFAQRLLDAGKPFKVAMIACMRKLLTILNVMVKNNEHWRSPVLQNA